jgi:hypothetical protein
VRGRLVGDDVGLEPAAYKLRQNVCGIGLERDRPGDLLAPVPFNASQRIVEIRRLFIGVACRQAALNALTVHFDDQSDAVVHCDGERLGPSHTAETSGDDDAAG